MNIDDMTHDEVGLLLYLETRAVDHSGFVDMRKMNDEDIAIARRWTSDDFIVFRRVPAKVVMASPRFRDESSYVILSDEAWEVAGELRKLRGIATKARDLDPVLNMVVP